MDKKRKQKIIVSVVLIFIGILICLMAIQIIPVDPKSINVPLWLFFLIGLLIITAGLLAAVPIYSRTSNFFASLCLSIFALILTWITLWGESAAFSGGIPFLPSTANIFIARLVFGLFAVVLWILSIYVLIMVFKRVDK